jgi:predicted RND superfamily exporter protein
MATVAALGAAQAVSLAWASRESQLLRPDRIRVLAAASLCVPAAAVSCLTGLAAGAALGFGSASFEKEFGLAVAAGLALQLLAAALLAPALLRVTYRTAPDQ